MGIDEVMAKWTGQFYDPEMSRALDERNMEVALIVCLVVSCLQVRLCRQKISKMLFAHVSLWLK